MEGQAPKSPSGKILLLLGMGRVPWQLGIYLLLTMDHLSVSFPRLKQNTSQSWSTLRGHMEKTCGSGLLRAGLQSPRDTRCPSGELRRASSLWDGRVFICPQPGLWESNKTWGKSLPGRTWPQVFPRPHFRSHPPACGIGNNPLKGRGVMKACGTNVRLRNDAEKARMGAVKQCLNICALACQ